MITHRHNPTRKLATTISNRIAVRAYPFSLGANRRVELRCERMTIYATGMLRDAPESAKPLAVPVKTACKLVGVGNTTM